MTEQLDSAPSAGNPFHRVRSVEDFCRRYRLDQSEQDRLTDLFGAFTSEQTLLTHAMRMPRIA